MDIKLMISDATRNEIYALLNDFVSVLNGQEITEEDGEKLQEQCNDLLAELRRLKRFKFREDDGEPRRKTIRKSAGPATLSEHLELSYELKQEIVNLLQQNQEFSIEFLDDLSEEDKQKLVAENEQLIEKLKRLESVSAREITAVGNKDTAKPSSQTSGQTPSQTPSQPSSHPSSETSNETPSHTSSHTPVHTPGHSPAHTTVATTQRPTPTYTPPSYTPSDVPDQPVAKCPSPVLTQPPVQHPTQSPTNTTDQIPVTITGQTATTMTSQIAATMTSQTAATVTSQTFDLEAFDRKLKKELDERALLLDELFKQELDKSIAEVDAKLNALKLSNTQMAKELNLLRTAQKKMAKDLNVNSPEKVFKFNLQNVRAFFNDTTKRFSEFFFCLSFKWSILAYHVKKRGKVSDRAKFLQLHLFREDGLDEDKHEGQSINWECNTTFEIRILSQSSKVEDRVESFDYTFVQPSEYASFGETEFINYHDLQTGYINADGSIDIQVFLKVNSYRRY